MKNFVKRKPYGGQRKINSSRGGAADSPYLQTNEFKSLVLRIDEEVGIYKNMIN